MKNPVVIVIILLIVILAMFGACSDSSSSSRYSGYSSTYANDADYRNDVGEIADVFGVSEWEVDRKINAATGGR